jgi:putative transposase
LHSFDLYSNFLCFRNSLCRLGQCYAEHSFFELKDAGIKISMDGRGRWMDNVMIERLWRTLKYECVYLNAFETGSEARNGIGKWIRKYNEERPHSSLDDKTPHEAYWNLPKAGYSGKLAA